MKRLLDDPRFSRLQAMFKIENSTGLSIEEMNVEQDKLVERTIEAMKLRSIDRPKVSNPLAVRVQECEQTFAWYRLPSYSKKKRVEQHPRQPRNS